MTKEELFMQIDQVLHKLNVLEACQNQFPNIIDSCTLKQTVEWLELMKEDISTGNMPEFYYPKASADLQQLNIQQIRDTQEDMHSFLSQFVDNNGQFEPIKSIRKAIVNIYSYEVLRAINFAKENSVIVGPNGCGKTTLANTFTKSITQSIGIVIPAQKLLIAPNIKGIPWPDEINNLYQKYQVTIKDAKRTYDYQNESSFPFELVKSFGDELQNVFLQFLADWNQIKTDVFKAQRNGKTNSHRTKIDEAKEIWNDLMQERQLDLDEKDHFVLTFEGTSYAAHLMSEGEKEILYLIGRVLFAPENGYIIVDEPEIYLHKTIVNKLWDKLEQKRTDCKFIYMTHDLDFAATRHAQKCWIKKFHYPCHWEILSLDESEIPEELLLTILGSRKKILFCEGTKDSKDVKILEQLFPNYTITPLASCTKVINYTKAFNNIPNRLVNAYGIIDRDFRTDEQLEAFKQHQIYTYDVAEIENLFLIDDFVNEFAFYIHKKELLDRVDFHQVIIEKFRPQIEKHALNYVTSLINYYFEEQKLHTQNSLEEMIVAFQNFCNKINVEEEYRKRKAYLEEICNKSDYEAVLRVANNKGLASVFNNILKIQDFSDWAFEFLKNTDAKKYLRGSFPPEL